MRHSDIIMKVNLGKLRRVGAEVVVANLYTPSDSTTLSSELISLLQHRFEQIDIINESVVLGFDCLLDLHCAYTRNQLLVAIPDKFQAATTRKAIPGFRYQASPFFIRDVSKSNCSMVIRGF